MHHVYSQCCSKGPTAVSACCSEGGGISSIFVETPPIQAMNPTGMNDSEVKCNVVITLFFQRARFPIKSAGISLSGA